MILDKAPLWIEGGQVIDPSAQRDGPGDVFAVDGRIVEGLDADQRKHARRIDANGLVVCPGLVDIHVHFREPGQTHKETIETGTRAAAAGGFTTVVCMPNTSPPCDNAGTIEYIHNVIASKACVRVHTTGCITVGRKGERLAPIGSLKRAGVVAITDDGDCIQNSELMRRAVEYAKMFDLPVMDHCQDMSMTAGSVVHEGMWSLKLGLRGWPSPAEDIIVARNIILSSHTGAHIHMQHVSSAYSVDIIRRAKQRGIRVTAEATPHHLSLTDECIREYNTNFKMNPPLRAESDRQALIEGLVDGTLDIIATDHAPHTPDEKDVEFDYAPFGITGLETALPVCLETLVNSGKVGLPFLIERLSTAPAKLLHLEAGSLKPGSPADVVVFDPKSSFVFEPARTHSRSFNSPWNHRALHGEIRYTFVGGRLVHEAAVSTAI
ncbi:MAG: dihydroorotase [Opitutales bacterium]